MAARRPQTIVKRQREQALREKRERKQAKKDARAAEKLAIANGEQLEPTGDEPVEGEELADDADAQPGE
jgi:hypothetical protein